MNNPINTSTRLYQVKTYLLNFIRQSKLERNDQLPSEAALANKLGVSRNTLREAYIALENEGIIVRRHGVGTFMANSPFIRDSLNEFSPFAQIIKDGGYTPNFRTLSMECEFAPPEACDALSAEPSEKLRHIKRLVQADQQPVIYVDEYVALFADTPALNWDSFDGNMVQFLAESLDTPLHHIHSCIRAAALEPDISPILELSEGAPILSVRSTIFTVENQPVTFSKIYFNSNIVELNIVRIIRTN